MTSFEEKIVSILDRIPRGKVITYKALAKLAGRPKAVRAVANAVGKNPHAPLVPCHRVVRSDGALGGYSAKKGIPEKIRLLKKEGVLIVKNRIDLIRFGWRPGR
jgi:methylated-DNA-[protein]-cysteine S-methyltransferase